MFVGQKWRRKQGQLKPNPSHSFLRSFLAQTPFQLHAFQALHFWPHSRPYHLRLQPNGVQGREHEAASQRPLGWPPLRASHQLEMQMRPTVEPRALREIAIPRPGPFSSLKSATLPWSEGVALALSGSLESSWPRGGPLLMVKWASLPVNWEPTTSLALDPTEPKRRGQGVSCARSNGEGRASHRA